MTRIEQFFSKSLLLETVCPVISSDGLHRHFCWAHYLTVRPLSPFLHKLNGWYKKGKSHLLAKDLTVASFDDVCPES